MKKISFALCTFFAAVLLLTGLSRPAVAAYPDRPVTIIIPFGPGGAVDIAARILAEYAQNKHSIVLNVVCKAGGAGAPAMLDVSRARPDGYTFGFPGIAPFATVANLKKTGYSLKDFRPVAQITNMWLSLAVNGDSPIKDVKGLIDAAKAQPGKFNYGTHGAYSTQNLLLRRILTGYPDVQLPHIVYTSGHEVSTALLGRHITAGFGVTTNQKPYVLSGDFKMIAVTSDKRLPEFPDVPTLAEQFGPEYVFGSPHGLLAPKRVPDAQVEFMQNLIKEALADPDVQAKFAKAGLSTDYESAVNFGKTVDRTWNFLSDTLKSMDAK